MPELVCSNFPPLRIAGTKRFDQVFYSELENASQVRLASGYISNDSIAQLGYLYKQDAFNAKIDLIIGMHLFEGFSRAQLHSLKDLSQIIKGRQLGSISLATVSKYHGKAYTFQSQSGISALVGSSNLSNIATSDRVYETDVFFKNEPMASSVDSFLQRMKNEWCVDFDSIESNAFKIVESLPVFNNHSVVVPVTKEYLGNVLSQLTPTLFEIALKSEQKSNLNCYFGKGRLTYATGVVIPRHWYEVELIVSKNITTSIDYPQVGQRFNVVTDDGFQFDCLTSGDYGKNLRSADDLKILGMWIKGRLENSGCLSIGNKVTEETLSRYGRNFITLTKTRIPNTWYLDFKV